MVNQYPNPVIRHLHLFIEGLIDCQIIISIVDVFKRLQYAFVHAVNNIFMVFLLRAYITAAFNFFRYL